MNCCFDREIAERLAVNSHTEDKLTLILVC
jgi:hypothetical protein